MSRSYVLPRIACSAYDVAIANASSFSCWSATAGAGADVDCTTFEKWKEAVVIWRGRVIWRGGGGSWDYIYLLDGRVAVLLQ